jgi:hypothetical protein
MLNCENLFEKINESYTTVKHLRRNKSWHEVILDKKKQLYGLFFLLPFKITHRYSFIPLKTMELFIGLYNECVTIQSELVDIKILKSTSPL